MCTVQAGVGTYRFHHGTCSPRLSVKSWLAGSPSCVLNWQNYSLVVLGSESKSPPLHRTGCRRTVTKQKLDSLLGCLLAGVLCSNISEGSCNCNIYHSSPGLRFGEFYYNGKFHHFLQLGLISGDDTELENLNNHAVSDVLLMSRLLANQ